jgi:hypothetical protein
MLTFQQMLWGYRLEYPEDWTHRTIQQVEGFAPDPLGLSPDASGPGSGHLLIQAEWNGRRLPIGPLWESHIARVAAMVGAHRVGSAPWTMGGGEGFETEIALPKKTDERLWVGILARQDVLLKFMVTHPKGDRAWFEPAATEILRSLVFLDSAEGIPVHTTGLPLPPGSRSISPSEALVDLPDPDAWSVFDTPHSFDSLHAFYAREAPVHGWSIESFESFPHESDPGFSRVRLSRADHVLALGLIPIRPDAPGLAWLGRIAIKVA